MENKRYIEIRTGSDSDIPKIKKAYAFLDHIGVGYSPRILSAHRIPQLMAKEAQMLAANGFRVCIAAAGGAAHLPGMTASETTVPVIGIPVKTSNLEGQDSLYSIIQMPNGIPVGTVGTAQDESAAIVAAQIAFVNDVEIRNKIREYRGLEPLSSAINLSKAVGVIKPTSIADSNDYSEMINLLEKLGLIAKEYTLSVIDFEGINNAISEIEADGISSIIVLGALDGKNTTNYFPGQISELTHIPVIGLPLAEGFAGSDQFIEGDIFNAMLFDKDNIGRVVAAMGINRYINAALFAAQIASNYMPEVLKNLINYKENLAKSVLEKDAKLKKEGVKAFL